MAVEHEAYVPIQTFEDYRISITSNGRRYKAIGHSVREDESLYIQFRSKLRPRRIYCGGLEGTPQRITGLGPNRTPELSGVKSIHYHPSGIVNLKGSGGEQLKALRSFPFQFLREPLWICSSSPASLGQLEVDNKNVAFGDYPFDLDRYQLERLQIQVAVGPKGSFIDERMAPPGCLERAVYNDAGLYDVAYFIGAAPEIDPDVEIEGVKLAATCIQSYPTDFTGAALDGIPNLPAAVWSTPPAISRQIRALLEDHVEYFVKHVGQASGAYKAAVFLCSDGAIAAVDWSTEAGYSFTHEEHRTRRDILYTLGWRETGTSKLKDAANLGIRELGRHPRTVFVRTRPSKSFYHNALVFDATDPPTGGRPYWRIPPAVLIDPRKLIDLIGSANRIPHV